MHHKMKYELLGELGSSRVKSNEAKGSKGAFVFLLVMLLLALGFTIGAFNYFREHPYESVFEDPVEVTSKYVPNTLLHSVKVNFRNKDLSLDHRLVPKYLKDGEQHSPSSFWNAFNSLNHLLDHESKNRKEIRVYEKERFVFKMRRLEMSHVESVECYSVNVTNRAEKEHTTGEVEVCFELGGQFWYGGKN